jgi:hypothetical protein
MLEFELFKPVRNFGLVLSLVGALGIVCHIVYANDPQYMIGAQIFVLVASTFHLFIGLSIVTRSRYGFRFLRLYLYLLYPGFPLGYFYAKKMFEYIEANKIERFFGKSIKIN